VVNPAKWKAMVFDNGSARSATVPAHDMVIRAAKSTAYHSLSQQPGATSTCSRCKKSSRRRPRPACGPALQRAAA
jgi:hypothetical protein